MSALTLFAALRFENVQWPIVWVVLMIGGAALLYVAYQEIFARTAHLPGVVETDGRARGADDARAVRTRYRGLARGCRGGTPLALKIRASSWALQEHAPPDRSPARSRSS